MEEVTPLSWEAHEYEYYEKTTDWYWSVGIIAVALAVVAVLMSNILFAVLVVVGAGTLILLARREPDVVEFELNSRGIVVGSTLYPYSTLDSFWVEDRFINDRLLVKSSKAVMPLIIIPIRDVHPAEVRNFLSVFLEEEEHEEPFSQKLMERLGF